MDENSIPEELMEEECYMSGGEGTSAGLCTNRSYNWHPQFDTLCVGSDVEDEDLDEPANLSGMGSIDPFDFVYSNLPESTHIPTI